MSDSEWTTVKAGDVKPGQRVRVNGGEMIASRLERPFLGIDSMIAFIEDTDQRWLKSASAVDADVEVRD